MKKIKLNDIKSNKIEFEEKTDKNYEELVKDKVNQIRNNKVYTTKEKIQKEAKEAESQGEVELKNTKNLFYSLTGIYVISVIVYIIYRDKKKKEKADYDKFVKEDSEHRRLESYLYLDNKYKEN